MTGLHHGLGRILTLQSPRFVGTLICGSEVNFYIYPYDRRRKGVDHCTFLFGCVSLFHSDMDKQNLAILVTRFPLFRLKEDLRPLSSEVPS